MSLALKILWIASAAVVLVLAIRICALGLFRQYRSFVIFLVASTVRTICLLPIDFNDPLYARVWIAGEAVLLIARVFVVSECFQLMTATFPRLGNYGAWTVMVCGTLSLLVAMFANPTANNAWSLFAKRVYLVRSTLLITMATFLALANIALRWWDTATVPNVRRHLNLALVYFGLTVALQYAILWLPSAAIRNIGAVQSVVMLACFGLWITAFRRSGEQHNITPPTAADVDQARQTMDETERLLRDLSRRESARRV